MRWILKYLEENEGSKRNVGIARVGVVFGDRDKKDT